MVARPLCALNSTVRRLLKGAAVTNRLQVAVDLYFNRLLMMSKFVKVHLTPIFFSAKMKLSNIHKRNLPIFLVSDIVKGFKNLIESSEI